jgi:hypothetical protein
VSTRDRGRDDHTDVAPGAQRARAELEPGKRTLSEIALTGDDAPLEPGKRTLTERAPGGTGFVGFAEVQRALAELRSPRSPLTPEDAAATAIDRKGAGRTVDPALAARVGGQVGVDVSDARVHDDPLSQEATRAISARAFAYGDDVFLGPGERSDDTALMAHELTHVAQQRGMPSAPQTKPTIGEASSPAERHADQIAAQVGANAAPRFLLVDGGSLAPGQMPKQDFVQRLRELLVRVIEHEVGRVGATQGCPYLERYLEKYAAQPAAVGEGLIRRWIPAAAHVASAVDLLPLIAARARDAARVWVTSGQLPGDLAAADPQIAGVGQPGAAHTKSLEGLERELGPGEPLDAGTAARMAGVIGADVSGARIHSGPIAHAKAAEAGAMAFAVGQNVVLGADAPTRGIAGDALLAHELAHTAQQKDAAADPAARKRPIGDEDAAAERDAGLARLGNFAGALGDVMRTGLQLQRCPDKPKKTFEMSGQAATDKLAELGGSLVTDPDYSGGRKAVVGSSIQYIVNAVYTNDINLGVYQWTTDTPNGRWQSITNVGRPDPIPSVTPTATGAFVNASNMGATRIPLNDVGTYTTDAWVRAGVNEGGQFIGYDLHGPHVLEVVPLSLATADAYRKTMGSDKVDSFEKFHDSMDMQMVMMRPGDPAHQNKGHQHQISTSAANPQAAGPGAISFSALDARADKTKPLTYHWYASPQTKDEPPKELGGKSIVSVAGRRGYDFGIAPSMSLPTELPGLWVVWYQAADASGAPVGEASYLQTVLAPEDVKALEKYDEYMTRLDELGGKLEGEKVPITGVHVSKANAMETRLRLFVGRKKGDTSTLLMIDATPGLNPKENRFEYTASSGKGVIDSFLSNNKYPEGKLMYRIGANSLGLPAGGPNIHDTSGQGYFDRLSSGLSVGGMVVLGLGALAAPFTEGQSLRVAMVISGGLTAAGAAVSIYERLQHAEVSGTGVALDVITIVSSLVNAGGAVRAMKGGPGVLLANRGTKFLLWANFVTDTVSALLISIEGVEQIDEILSDDRIPPEQKRAQIVRIVTNLVMAGAMVALSYGQLKEVRTKLEGSLGKQLAKDLSNDVAMTVSLLDEATLKSLATLKDAKPLSKLASALRDEPALLNELRNEARLVKALPLLKTGTAEELRYTLMRVTAHEGGAAAANTERLVAVLEGAGIPARSVAMWGDKAFASLAAHGNVLDELEQILPLVKSGKITGLEDWLKFGATKAAADAARSAGELREAARRSAENPKATVHIGGDERAPLDATGKKLPSFDMTVETGGTVSTSVEKTTVDDPVNKGNDLVTGVGHAADKVHDRDLAGKPIPGKREASIDITLASRWPQGKAGTIEITPTGDRTRVTRGAKSTRMPMTNIFDEFTDQISKSPNHALLDRIVVTDVKTGAVLAAYERTGTTWKRVQ